MSDSDLSLNLLMPADALGQLGPALLPARPPSLILRRPAEALAKAGATQPAAEGVVGAQVRDTIGRTNSVEKVAHDFESVLLQKVFEEMRRTVPESGLLESPESEQIQGLFWTYLAQDVADKGGIGLWKELARQLQPPPVAQPPPAESKNSNSQPRAAVPHGGPGRATEVNP